MTRTQNSAIKPSATTGLSRALRALLRVKGTGAPRRALLTASLTATLAVLALLYVSVAPALAAPPEKPEATGASAITATTATLEGVLNPNSKGLPGSFQFSYAPTAPEPLECAGGGVAPLPPAFATGLEKEAVSTPVTELQPNREYAFCLTAFSLSAEPSEPSPALAFKTPPAKPSVDAESTSGVTSTAATLEAQVNPNNEATTYTFEYSTEQSGGVLQGTIVTVPAAPAGPLEGFGDQTASAPTEALLPDTTYFYRVVATNGAGTTGGTVSETGFTTVATPTTEAATGVTSTTATFHGALTPLTETVGAEAEYSFAYNQGENCSGGTATPVTPAGTGTGPKTVEAEATGLQPGATYSVCLVSSNPFGSEIDAATSPQVSFTTLAGPPSIEAESSSGVSTESATLEATVNPNNQETTCSFEYSTEEAKVTANEGTVVPCSQLLGAGGGPATGSATLTGLQLKQTYFYRALAKNASGTTSDPTIESFETETTVAPTLESEQAQSITATTASLTGKVNPNGAQITACLVEYGPDTSYGHTAPCVKPDAAELGAGREPVAVTAPVTGLEANVTYHWRLTATSAAGTSTSVDHTFIDDTTPPTPPGSCEGQEAVRAAARSTNLPDCRAYEMVTPVEKNGSHFGALFANTGPWGPLIARDGGDVIAPTIQCLAQTESCTAIRGPEGEPYEFQRTPAGWVTHPLAPPATTFGISSDMNRSADLHTTLFSAPGPGTQNELYTRIGQGTPQDIGPVAEEPNQNLEQLVTFQPTAATADFSHIVLRAHPNSNGFLWSLDGQPEREPELYEYAGQHTGRPLAVAVTGGYESTTPVSECGAFLGGGQELSRASEFGSLSADGRVIYFTALDDKTTATCPLTAAAPPENELFARVDNETPGTGVEGAHTVRISAPTSGVCEGAECQKSLTEPREAAFEGASADGSRAFFTSTQQLTDHATQGEGAAGAACYLAPEGTTGCNLYESICAHPCGSPGEEPAAKGRELIDLSETADHKQTPGGPRVRGVMAISTDGSHVYFVAEGELTKNTGVQGTGAVDGKNNLYVYERDTAFPEGRLTFIATLPTADEEFPVEHCKNWTHGIECANVTPDGRFLVFLSHAALTPDDTRPDVEPGATPPAQIYRYDAETNSIVRITVGNDGYDDNNNASSAEPEIVAAQSGWSETAAPGVANPSMSDDGQYVFFESPVALTPGALSEAEVNGPPGLHPFAENIYEYHDGHVYLISDGKDTNPNPGDPNTESATRLVGTDSSGHDVFFWTVSQVLPQDTDTERDMYDARICENGDPCVPPPPVATGPCKEGTCQAAPATPSGSGAPASATFNGPGNLAPAPPPPPGKPKTLTKAQKLTKALKACRTKHNRHKRIVCEKQARHQFGTAAKAHRSTTKRRGR